jgi:hypothetical protein
LSGRRAARTAVVALALGVVTEVAVVMVALVDAPRIMGASEVMLIRGTAAWHGNDRSSALLRWINMETVGPLVNQGGDSGAVPAWAEPPAPADARLVRHAALAAGWPLPAVACSWTTDRLDVNFPPPIENETSGDAPKEAGRRSIAALRGDQAPTGGHGAMRILPGGFAAGAVAFALPWCAAVSLARIAIERRRGVTPRG